MIVSCPECNGKVSTTADKCPHCGHQINPTRPPAPTAPVAPAPPNVNVDMKTAGCLGGISQGMGMGCGCILLLVGLVVFFLVFAGAGHHR